MVLRGVFVTGTDTGVGKTAVCAALMHRYRGDGSLRYWKPIQTGVEQDDDTREVTALGACSADEVFTGGIRLPRPLSPHLAARLNGTTRPPVAVVLALSVTRGATAAAALASTAQPGERLPQCTHRRKIWPDPHHIP